MRPTKLKGDQGMSEDQMDQMDRNDEPARNDDVHAHQMDQIDRNDAPDA